MFDPDGFNIGAERAIFWTREQLENPSDRANNEKRWEFLGMLPRSHRLDSFLFVHGSPRNPLSEYIFPEDIYNHRKMERLFQLVEKYCFQGHTHVPGVFTEGYQFYAPEEIDNEYTLGEGKVMINVGSVGQPRDGDPRACYVILEDGLPPRGGPGMAPNRGHDDRVRPRGRPARFRRSSTPRPRSASRRSPPKSHPPPARFASRTGASLTTTRRRSRRSTRSRNSNPSWATGSARAADLRSAGRADPTPSARPTHPLACAPPRRQGLPHDEQREAASPHPGPHRRLGLWRSSYALEQTGLIKPPPEPEPPAEVAKEIGKDKEEGAKLPKAGEPAKADQPKGELPDDVFARDPSSREAGRTPSPRSRRRKPGPKAWSRPPNWSSARTRTIPPSGYHLRLQLDQKGAAVAQATSAEYDAEFDPASPGTRGVIPGSS